MTDNDIDIDIDIDTFMSYCNLYWNVMLFGELFIYYLFVFTSVVTT